MIFEFAAPNRIIFGEGTINKVGDLIIQQMGKNALIITGSGKVPIESIGKVTQ